MLGMLVVGCCAYFFYRLGELEYRHGALLAVVSIVISFLSPRIIPIPLPFISVIIGQLFLFITLWVYNCFRKSPPD